MYRNAGEFKSQLALALGCGDCQRDYPGIYINKDGYELRARWCKESSVQGGEEEGAASRQNIVSLREATQQTIVPSVIDKPTFQQHPAP
jgi:hypothetical protein